MGKDRTKKNEPQWKSLQVELGVIIVGVLVIASGLCFVRTPNAIPKPVMGHEVFPFGTLHWTITSSRGKNYTPPPTPHVGFDLSTTFEAQGNFGADNPITVHVAITNANLTLTDYYCCIRFWGSTLASNPSNASFGYLPLTHWNNGTYTADGTIIWAEGGPTWPYLYPNPYQNANTKWVFDLNEVSHNGTAPAFFTVGPITDTETWQNAQRSDQIGIISLGVLIVGPYEVLKRVVRH